MNSERFDKVVKWGTHLYNDGSKSYQSYNHYIAEDFETNLKIQTIYNKAFEIEASDPEKTFLFSAQHKDCIILATILTEMYDSNTIIWRPDKGHDEIDIEKIMIFHILICPHHCHYMIGILMSLQIHLWE